MKKLIALFVAILIISTGIAWFTSSRNKELKAAVLPKEITVYTTVSNEEMQFIASEFKEQTGITVNYEVVNNLQEAVENNKGKVDFVYGGNSEELNSMASAGLLEKSNLSFDSDISSLYKGQNGYWYGTSIEPIVMFYNSLYMLAKDAPQTWSALTAEAYKDKIVLNPNYQGYMQSITASLDADNESITGQQLSSGLTANGAVITNNSTDYLNDILKNDKTPISFAPMNEVQQLISSGNNLAIINSTDGSPLEVEGAAIVNGTKNLNAAELFMEFVAGAKVQLQLAEKFDAIPVSSNALSFAPSWMKTFNNINIAKNDWNLFNNGQFEAKNKNEQQAAEEAAAKSKAESQSKANASNNANAAADPLSQPNGAVVNLKPGSALTPAEQTAQDAMNQLQQPTTQVYTLT